MKSRLNFKIYQPIVFYVRCNDVTQTRQLENRSVTEVLQMQQNANMSLYTCSMLLNGLAQELLNLKKNNDPYKSIQVHKKKLLC